MFGRGRSQRRTTRIDSLIGKGTDCGGDVVFEHGLHIDGVVRGTVRARQADAILSLGRGGRIEGEVRVSNIVLAGTVLGDVHAGRHLTLDATARVTGIVYYRQIEMAMGAEVNGQLVRLGHGLPAEARPISQFKGKTASKY
jgi:cytoskeletal protein CcmA (bactofilin family)